LYRNVVEGIVVLHFSGNAIEVKPIFYKYYNDIDVYVEDENDEIFYEKMLCKVVSSTIRINRVFGVGGKIQLFEKLDEYIREPSSRKVFFIADGDFDRILNRRFPDENILHVLREYCIENYLFEALAIYNVIQEETPRKKIKEIRRNIKISNWLEESVNKLTPLFACFILVQKHDMGIKNVNLGIGKFITNGGIPRIEKGKIDDYMNGVKTNYEEIGKKNFYKEIESILRSMGRGWVARKRYICGKNFLLPLLRFEIKRYFGRDLNPESFRFRIMNHCRFKSLSKLGKQIEVTCDK